MELTMQSCISCFFSPISFLKSTRNIQNQSMEKSSSFELLPLEIQETIFSFLPISTLIICTAVSRSFRSTIRSQRFTSSYTRSQPLFSFYSINLIHNTYDPDLDRWFSLPLPHSSGQIRFLSGPFHLLESYCKYFLFDPFVDLNNTARTDAINVSDAFPLSLVAILMSNSSPKSFKLLAVNLHLTSIMIYDSRTKEWAELVETACNEVHLSYPAVYLHDDDNLFYLSDDQLVTFDFKSRTRQYLTERLPIDSQRYLFGVDKRLFLVGGNRDRRLLLINIGIWEFDFLRKDWNLHCFMPQDMFAEFSEGRRIQIVDRKGILCFLDVKVHGGSSILICNVLRKKWRWPKGFERGKVRRSYTHCIAVEPYIDLVKAGN